MYIFPAHMFRPADVSASIAHRVISGGETLSGIEDVIATDGGGRWMISYSGITLDEPDLIRAWSAWQGHLAGGVNECLVPLLSVVTAPRPSLGHHPMQPSDILTDDALFPTYLRFSSPHIVASVGAAAALRATELQINVTQGSPVKGGEKFSLGTRAYRIIRKVYGNRFLIEPPLREAVSIGTAVNFDWPSVKCRLVPGEGVEPLISFDRMGEASISFVEIT